MLLIPTTLSMRNKDYQRIDFPFSEMIPLHLFHLSLCNCPRYPLQPQLVHSSSHSEALTKTDMSLCCTQPSKDLCRSPSNPQTQNVKWFSMSACLFWLRGLCLYIIIYLLQCRIQRVNYYLTACLDFKPFLLAPCQKLNNLASFSFAAPSCETLTGKGRCTQRCT